MSERAVCLVSGGMDSCVSAAIAHAAGLELGFLHVRYGQLTESRELKAFEDISDFYSVRHRLVVEVGHLARIGGSALTDPAIALPPGDLGRTDIPVSYVPFRNGNLLSIAASWAEVLGAGYIYIGAVEEDGSGYPDCREEFFRAFDRAINEGTRPETRLRIKTPLIRLRKSGIVKRGVQLGVPFHLTWSCYRSLDVPCGRCDSCLLRCRGFDEAGCTDPLLERTSGSLHS